MTELFLKQAKDGKGVLYFYDNIILRMGLEAVTIKLR